LVPFGAVCCRLLPFGAGRSAPERIGGLLDSWIGEEQLGEGDEII